MHLFIKSDLSDNQQHCTVRKYHSKWSDETALHSFILTCLFSASSSSSSSSSSNL